MYLTPEQQRVAKKIVRIGNRRGESRKEIKAALETGLVESNLSNPKYGDADSQGWRQERSSLYKNPTNLRASINRFYNETSAVEGKYKRAGDLAAAVQRPAEQYRGRYQGRKSEATQILRSMGGSSAGGTKGGGRYGAPSFSTTPGVDNSGVRQGLLQNYLLERGRPNALLGLAQGLKGAQDTAATTTLTPGGRLDPVTGRSGHEDGNALVDAVLHEAKQINRAHVPYQWGGGHGAKQVRGSKVTPLDCSGAVSRALGINPRVSGEFASWGKAGEGKRVTIYANGEHVLMKIDGRFWGTSASNPGGGAGWIPAKQISREYLSRFSVRHPKGM